MSEIAMGVVEAPEFNPDVEGEASASGLAEAVNGNFDADLIAETGVERLGDVIPSGTKAIFAVKSYKTGFSNPWKATEKNPAGHPEYEPFGPQPYFNVRLACQQEPFTGRLIFEFIQFVNERTQSAAKVGDPVARKLVKQRCTRLRSILEAAGFPTSGKLDVMKFLDGQPEVGVVCGVGKRMDGSPNNTVAQYYNKSQR